jgi:hypothetical protein
MLAARSSNPPFRRSGRVPTTSFWRKFRLKNPPQSLQTRETGETPFLTKVRLRNPGQSLGTAETGETCFWEQGPAQKPCQSLETAETGETCFWEQGPAQKSWPIIGDSRDGRDMFLGARSGSEILANHWGHERRERHVFGRALMLWIFHDAYNIRGQT